MTGKASCQVTDWCKKIVFSHLENEIILSSFFPQFWLRETDVKYAKNMSEGLGYNWNGNHWFEESRDEKSNLPARASLRESEYHMLSTELPSAIYMLGKHIFGSRSYF